jgi:protein O-GlcNAc transferase
MNVSFRAIVTATALFVLLCSIETASAAPNPTASGTPKAATPAPTVAPTAPPPTAAPAGSPASASSLYSQAQIDAASGRNQVARDELQRASLLDPSNLGILRLLGDVEYRLEHFEAAEAAYKAVIAKDPTDRAVHNRLGGVYAAEGRIDDAVSQFRLSLPSQEGITNLVEVFQEEGKLNELEAEDRSDMDRAPNDDPYTRFQLGMVLAAEKRYPESIALYQQAIDFKSDFWEAHNGLGIVYGEVGRYADAIAQYKRALDEHPDCFQCWMNWGVELINSGDPTSAIDKIQKAITINPQFALAYMNMGVAYDATGNFQKAIELYQQAITYDPRAPQVYYNLGSDYFEHGLLNLAEAAFIKGIAIHPRDSSLHLALGYYYQDRRQYAQAIEQYKLAMTYDPSDSRAKSYLTQVEALAGH